MIKRNNKKGFTIVELVIVIAVIAILAAVLIPTFAGIIKKANLSADEQAVRQLNEAIAIVSVDKKFESIDDVTVALLNENIDISEYSPMTKDHSFYWVKAENKIVLVDKDKKVVSPEDLATLAYDENGWEELASSVLYNALGGTASIGSDGKVDLAAGNTSYAIEGTTVLNLGETVISYNLSDEKYELYSGSTVDGSAFCANGAEANLTVNEGVIEGNLYGISARNGATVTINGTSVTVASHAVYAQEGTVYVTGGFFCSKDYDPTDTSNSNYVLNCKDAAYEAETANIIVTGGTFVNFNPADNRAEGEHTNFVADGYTVKEETQANGDIWYTVVKG